MKSAFDEANKNVHALEASLAEIKKKTAHESQVLQQTVDQLKKKLEDVEFNSGEEIAYYKMESEVSKRISSFLFISRFFPDWRWSVGEREGSMFISKNETGYS